MLHFLNQAGGFRPSQETFYIPQTRSKTNAAYSHSPAEALRAFCELVGVLCTLPVESSPLPRATTHITRHGSCAGALNTLVLQSSCAYMVLGSAVQSSLGGFMELTGKVGG